MKRKQYISLVSALLILQFFIYLYSESEQRKEVVTPHAQVAVTSDKVNSLAIQSEKAEEMNFEANPVSDYYQINPDYVGWLTLEDTAIDYPVARSSDNDYYLDHNFYREDDVLGAIFMDYRNIGMGKDKHTVIYGHYSRHGQMFKDLDLYLAQDFLNNHLEFTFTDAFSERTYQIFSVHHSYADPALIDLVFEHNDFLNFTESLKNKSLFSLETPVTAEDKILTLVTCNYTVDNGRLFIHAVEQIE